MKKRKDKMSGLLLILMLFEIAEEEIEMEEGE